jgi:tRNA dimethylallyltransferase
VHSMVAAGLVQEVLGLLGRYGLTPEQATPEVLERCFPTAHKAIGVLQVCAYLRGECSLAEAVAQVQLISRQYAKRQATWFRREVGFQTICLSAEFLPELFPCLSLLHLPARSSLT